MSLKEDGDDGVSVVLVGEERGVVLLLRLLPKILLGKGDLLIIYIKVKEY